MLRQELPKRRMIVEKRLRGITTDCCAAGGNLGWLHEAVHVGQLPRVTRDRPAA